MLNIAICDDDERELANITTLFQRYQEEKNITIVVNAFSSAIELLESLQVKNYDFIVMDILMPGLTGIQAAHEIRTYDTHLPIIFLTSSPEFAVESYSVDAFYYLLKPTVAEQLFPVLDRLLTDIRHQGEYFTLTLSTGVLRLPFSGIEYLEVNNKHLIFSLEGGTIREVPGTLNTYEPLFLMRKEFIKVHRSYVVNMAHIRSLESNEIVTYSGKRIPIARALISEVRKEYTDFLFDEEK